MTQGALVVARPLHATDFANWLRRVVAAALDSALIGAASWLSAADRSVAWIDLAWTPFLDGADGDVGAGGAAAVLALLMMQATLGWTPGKLTLAMRVLDEQTGLPLGFWRTIARWFLHLLDAVLLIGYLRPLWHERRQTWADSIMHSVVVTELPRTGWRLPAAWLSGVGCALVLLFGSASTSTSPMFGMTCPLVAVTPSEKAPAGQTVSVRYEPGWLDQQRLGVTRRLVDPDTAVLSVFLESPLAAGSDLRLRAVDTAGTVHEQTEPGDRRSRSATTEEPVEARTADLELRLPDGNPQITSFEVETIVNGTVVQRCSWTDAGRR